jgi:hypothetical protein
VQPGRHAHIAQDVFALAHQGVVDLHARVVDHRMHHAIGIGLRRPHVVVDRLRIGLAGGVELEDGDHLARLGLFDQVAVMEAPVRCRVRAEAATGKAMVAARARLHIEDAHLQHIARLGAFHHHRPGQQVHAHALAFALLEGPRDRPCAAPRNGLVFARPGEDRLGPRVALHHALMVVVGVVGERLDGGAVARLHREGRRHRLAEVAPMNGLGRNAENVVLHGQLCEK